MDKQTVAPIFQNTEDFYWCLGQGQQNQTQRSDALLLLELRDWYIQACEFDPGTGLPLPLRLSDFLKLARQWDANEPIEYLKDRLTRIIEHTAPAIQSILKNPREKVQREHTMVPLYAVREVDSTSVQWISRQPGKTLREKLAGKPYIKAVNRRMSLDTAENRLLRAFLLKLEQLLMAKSEALGTTPRDDIELQQMMQRWLLAESSEIGQWTNLPPNNTLLQDRNYRRVWDAWLGLQALDEHILGDHRRLQQDWQTLLYWSIIVALEELEPVRLVEQPCYFDYDSFNIETGLSNITGIVMPQEEFITGSIIKIGWDKNDLHYGFINTDQHTGIFFHSRELLNPLDVERLAVGSRVSFLLEQGSRGMTAKRISLVEDLKAISLWLSPRAEINISLVNKIVQISPAGEREVILRLDNGRYSRDIKFNCTRPNIPKITEQVLSFLFEASRSHVTNRVLPTGELVGHNQHIIIDLCSTRPKLIVGSGSEQKTPFRLIRQYWSSEQQGITPIDLGEARAMYLGTGITTISMLDLFSESREHLTNLLNDAAMAFTEMLYQYTEAEDLIYLVPDAVSDFSLERLRKNINAFFPDSEPLPRSIAAVFAWQASKNFLQTDFQDGDCVLVLENTADGVFLTPLLGCRLPELEQRLPESRGIYWERHPSMQIAGDRAVELVKRALEQDDLNMTSEIANIFGFEGVIDELTTLSWVDTEGQWYQLPGQLRERLRQEAFANSLLLKDILRVREELVDLAEDACIYLLPIGDSIKPPQEEHSFKWLGSAWSLTRGAQILQKWQAQAEEISLWHDHLPELSLRAVSGGLFELFNLVKDQRVTPKRGMPVPIAVERSFSLPEGQAYYEFPLIQGAGGQELQYVAYLHSPAFPLKENTDCNLVLTYTYGADDPYDLHFVPKHPQKAGFKAVRVQWRESRRTQMAEISWPGFPQAYAWTEFENYPKVEGESTNLLDWICQQLHKIKALKRFFAGDGPIQVGDRVHADISKGFWSKDKLGDWYCRFFIPGYAEVFLHQEEFEQFDREATEISFDFHKNNRGFVARNVTLGRSIPQDVGHNLRRSIRFPVLTVWNNAHSLSEMDVPDWFRKEMQEAIENCLFLMKQAIQPELLDELFFFMCCLHKDTPQEVFTQLEVYASDKKSFKKYHRSIALSIGDAQLDWQKSLLKNLVDGVGKKGTTGPVSLQALSIALWRVEGIVHGLNLEEISKILIELVDCLKSSVDELKEEISVYKRQYFAQSLTSYLELLLALLRTRSSQDEQIKRVLSPEKEITRRFATLIDQLTEGVYDCQLSIRSRVILQIDKPETFHNTPDLMYALRMYLTGDTGANAIQVTGISNDN